MYNLNVNVNPSPTGAAGLLGVTAAAAEVTPRTPEIVNSLIAMTNPFEGYGSGNEKGMRDRTDSTSSGEPSPPSVQHTCSQLIKEGLKLTLQTKRRANSSGDDSKKKTKKEDGSGADDEEEDEASNNNNKAGKVAGNESTRLLVFCKLEKSKTISCINSFKASFKAFDISKFPTSQDLNGIFKAYFLHLKAGISKVPNPKNRNNRNFLKTIEDTQEISLFSRKDMDIRIKNAEILCSLQLTPEDEERRRRRRERNKIAATKCRLKKREKTVILVQESEILETQNHDLKSQIQELETQRRRLVDMLSLHGPTCLKGVDTTSFQQFAEPLHLPSYQDNFVPQQPPPALNQPQNCVTEYPVKVEEYETDFYRQGSPFVPTTSDAGCTSKKGHATTEIVLQNLINNFLKNIDENLQD
ncbi:hypothetical protein DBV15_01334 [Temnothorax longispinosus]|uniref:BZIP domain-containing protein n=1 Tax=Temnothorax longispinosus TaxID=300112 RepID=A0A4S2KJC6_9HYME|nr:hypothetical protein DBV15_01334 [Temnothorax longispinosus]